MAGRSIKREERCRITPGRGRVSMERGKGRGAGLNTCREDPLYVDLPRSVNKNIHKYLSFM